MKKLIKSYSLFSFAALLASCSVNDGAMKVEVANTGDFDRLPEMVRVELNEVLAADSQVVVFDVETGKEVQAQLLDENNDHAHEAILFQVEMAANSKSKYLIKKGVSELQASEVATYGRFVPERTDDFTWENDHVAFRVYGPVAQQMVERGEPGGTLSGGVDCWLKKVDYPIINKWYAQNVIEPGYYHIDHGEGLDNYHVGPSLGCGGTGVMVNDTLVTSLNYTGYEVLSNGPLQTAFSLAYAPFGFDDVAVHQTKTGSVTLGNQFTKWTVEVDGTDVLTTGVTLHENGGEVTIDSTNCFVSYWAPHFGEELGTAIVVAPKYIAGYSHVVSAEKDKSHVLIHLKVIDGKVEYYAGFGWTGADEFSTKDEWESYLKQFAKQQETPLLVTVK